jgi:hypothetical protein
MKAALLMTCVSLSWAGLFSLASARRVADSFKLRPHGDVKSKAWIANRDSFSVDDARFTNADLSPSTDVYRIPLREPTSIVFTLRNVGDETFNVTTVRGYLRAFHKYDFAVDTYPPMAIGDGLLEPHSEATFEWTLAPYPDLQSAEYVLSVDVAYAMDVPTIVSTVSTDDYSQNVLNVTIAVSDSSTMSAIVDVELWFMLMMIVVLGLIAGAVVYSSVMVPRQIAAGKTPVYVSEIVDRVALRTEPMLGENWRYLSATFWLQTTAISSGTTTIFEASKKSSSTTSGKSFSDDWLSGTGASRKKSKRH